MKIDETTHYDSKNRIKHYGLDANIFTQVIYTNNVVTIAFPFGQWKTVTLSKKAYKELKPSKIIRYEDSQGNYWDENLKHKCPYKDPTLNLKKATLELVLQSVDNDLAILKQMNQYNLGMTESMLTDIHFDIARQLTDSGLELEDYKRQVQFHLRNNEVKEADHIIGLTRTSATTVTTMPDRARHMGWTEEEVQADLMNQREQHREQELLRHLRSAESIAYTDEQKEIIIKGLHSQREAKAFETHGKASRESEIKALAKKTAEKHIEITEAVTQKKKI